MASAWLDKFSIRRSRRRCEAQSPQHEREDTQLPPSSSEATETEEQSRVPRPQEWDESEYDIIESLEEIPEEERETSGTIPGDVEQHPSPKQLPDVPVPYRKEAEISTVAVMGTNSASIKQALTDQPTAQYTRCNSLEDTLYEVNRVPRRSLEYRYKKLFTPEAVIQLGDPLSLQDCACASNNLSLEAQKMIEYVKNNICSNMIQQVIGFTATPDPAILDKLLPQMFGPSVPTMVLAYKSGSRRSLKDLHNTLSMTSAVSQSGKVLVVTDDMSSLKKKCFDNDHLTEEAVKMLEEIAVERANHVADPVHSGNCPSLQVQTSTVYNEGRPDFDRFRDHVNSHSCKLLVYDTELALLLHLKAYGIKNNSPVISLAYYHTAASHFALTWDQAEYILKKYQKAWLLYQPNEYLQDFIFLDLQWLNDAFNTALCFPQASGDPFCSSWHHLQVEGKLDHTLLEHIASRTPSITGVDLPRNWLLKLLEHLQVLATFPQPPLSDHLCKAFTPLLLPEESSAEELKSFHPNADIASEYFLPFSGHAPPPLYMARLITVLSKQVGFSLRSCKSTSSAIFELNNYPNILVRISEWKGFVRVQFCCSLVGKRLDNREKREIAAVLNTIIPTADKLVCNALIPDHFLPCVNTPNARMYLTCSGERCSYKEKHLAFCNYRNAVVECTKSGLQWHRSSLPASQQFWFEEQRYFQQHKHCLPSSTRPASYVSVGEVTDDIEASFDLHQVNDFLDRLDHSLYLLLDLTLVRSYLFQYSVLNEEQMHRLVLKKEQQQDEAWTLLSSNVPNTTTPLQPPVCHDPHKDAFDVIMGAVRSAGPRGVMALVATLMESSVGNEDHRSLLNNIQEDSAYTSIKKAWLKSVLSK